MLHSLNKVVITIIIIIIIIKMEVFRYTQLTYLNMQSMTLEDFGNFLKQKNKNVKKHKKAGIFALLDEKATKYLGHNSLPRVLVDIHNGILLK